MRTPCRFLAFSVAAAVTTLATAAPKNVVLFLVDDFGAHDLGYEGSESRGAFGYSVRSTRFRYIEWIDTKSARTVGRDLFDFEQDPQGRQNFAEDPHYSDTVAELSALLYTNAKGWKLLERHIANQ